MLTAQSFVRTRRNYIYEHLSKCLVNVSIDDDAVMLMMKRKMMMPTHSSCSIKYSYCF